MASGGSLVRELLAIVCPGQGFSSPAIGISGKPIAVDSLIEQPCLHCPGRHPFRDLSGSGGFASIIASWLRYFLVPSPKKRLFPFHLGALWFRRLASAPGFALILSYCFAAVHLGSAGDIVGPSSAAWCEHYQRGKGAPTSGFSGDKMELDRLAAEARDPPGGEGTTPNGTIK